MSCGTDGVGAGAGCGGVDGRRMGGGVMRGCHSCEHAGAIAAGVYRDTPWEQTPCAECRAGCSSSVGAMCFDEDRSPEDWTDGGDGDDRGDDRGETAADALPVSVMNEVVHGLLSLPPELRDTVCLRFQGVKYREIAALHGVTVSGAEKRHRRALACWPVLRALFAVKAAKQNRRKRHGKAKGRTEGPDGGAAEGAKQGRSRAAARHDQA